MTSRNQLPWVALAVLAPGIVLFTDLFSYLWPMVLALSALPIITVVAASQGDATETSKFAERADLSSRISVFLLFVGTVVLVAGVIPELWTTGMIIASVLVWAGAMLRIRVQEARRSVA